MTDRTERPEGARELVSCRTPGPLADLWWWARSQLRRPCIGLTGVMSERCLGPLYSAVLVLLQQLRRMASIANIQCIYIYIYIYIYTYIHIYLRGCDLCYVTAGRLTERVTLAV